MLVRCEKCGYENFPQHRFCGMCGAGLRTPQPAAAPPASAHPASPPKAAAAGQASAPQSVSGPSFLGLADEPTHQSDVSYLLEDEPDSSHPGRYVVLIILIAAVAAAAWHWRQDLRSWAGKFAGSPSAGSSEAASSSASSPTPAPPAASPSQTAPAVSANPDTHVEKPSTGVGDQQATSQPQASLVAAAAPTAATPSAASGAAQPQQTVPSQQPTQSQQQDNSGSGQSAPKVGPPAAAAAESSATKSPALVKPSKAAVESASPAAESDALEAQGENYLYGNGVPVNCARAQKSLLAAAARSSAKAQSVLGAMYATGHCATRDLPVAYRWFARALRQDPSNTRYEQDLKVLWGQMTAEERQLALRNER